MAYPPGYHAGMAPPDLPPGAVGMGVPPGQPPMVQMTP